jgi:hypothetical protein
MRAHEFYKINAGNALSICGARIVAMTFQPSGKNFAAALPVPEELPAIKMVLFLCDST